MSSKPRDQRGTSSAATREEFTTRGTLGVEEELYFVDGAGRPCGGVHEFLEAAAGRHPVTDRLDTETYDCIVETKTAVCDGVDELGRELAETRSALEGLARQYGHGVAAAGLHPVMRWQDQNCVPKQRYREMLDRFRYPQWRNTTTGLHVHVGVDDADEAVWVSNELRWYMPVVLALSANSPIYGGTDTGLQSARAKIFGNLPHTGIPPAFDSFEEFRSFERTMVQTDASTDFGELWYDVRPHPGQGTVEIRAPDAQADMDRVLALVEYVHELVRDLSARYEDGESGTEYRRAFLEENRWRALRYGHDATFVARDEDGTVDLSTVVERECARLGVSGIQRLLHEESGAAMQRRLWHERGPGALCAGLYLRRGRRRQRQSPTPETEGSQRPRRQPGH